MELIFKSEKSLENIKKLRSFLLSDRWMAFLFVFAGLFTTLSALFPGKQIEIKATLVFVLIIGACLVISDDIMAGLAPFMLTSLIAIKCYDSFDVFMGYKWIFVPVVFCILFHFIAYKGKWALKGELLVPMVFVSVSIFYYIERIFFPDFDLSYAGAWIRHGFCLSYVPCPHQG